MVALSGEEVVFTWEWLCVHLVGGIFFSLGKYGPLNTLYSYITTIGLSESMVITRIHLLIIIKPKFLKGEITHTSSSDSLSPTHTCMQLRHIHTHSTPHHTDTQLFLAISRHPIAAQTGMEMTYFCFPSFP